MPTNKFPLGGRRPLSTRESADPWRSSYLDDPGHVFELDPSSHGASAEAVLAGLLGRRAAPEDLVLIMTGGEKLFAKSVGTAAECLDTSMIWLYG